MAGKRPKLASRTARASRCPERGIGRATPAQRPTAADLVRARLPARDASPLAQPRSLASSIPRATSVRASCVVMLFIHT